MLGSRVIPHHCKKLVSIAGKTRGRGRGEGCEDLPAGHPDRLPKKAARARDYSSQECASQCQPSRGLSGGRAAGEV